MQKVVMHIDMNSFFASCEQQDNPSLRGRPIGVCEHLGGLIIAPSVEAKQLGIKTGMPVWEAKKLYPKIVLVKVGAARYRFYSRRLIKLVSDYTDAVQQYSIDEVFLDVTKQTNIQIKLAKKWQLADPFEEAARMAADIKLRMKTKVGDYLRCSIGIAKSKLVAKIASDLKKPDGLTVIKPTHESELYQKLKLTDIPGIGHRMERNLNELGIQTLLDLKNYPESKLVAHFGFPGHQLWRLGQLQDGLGSEVELDEEIKSMGHMYTLPQKFRSKENFPPVLYKLSEMVAERLRKQGLMGNVIHFYVSAARGQSFGHSKKLKYFLQDGREIFLEALQIYESLRIQSTNFKLIGITVAGLTDFVAQQRLFPKEQRQAHLSRALDKVNDKYGDFTVCRVPVWQAREAFADSVGFGRIKEL